MKKIFSIFLICCATFVFANAEPTFEETDEKVKAGAYATFAAVDPVFEEDNESECNTCNECGDPNHKTTFKKDTQFFSSQKGRFKEHKENSLKATCMRWTRYKTNFGMEKLFVRFPQNPTISQSNALLCAHAYDSGVLYSLSGYYPAIGNINPNVWFDEIIYTVDHYPYNLISKVSYQASNGDWVMDYTSHDYVQNLIVKARAIVTPFNGYTLQCVKPNGSRDYFDYFLENFYIRCDCN